MPLLDFKEIPPAVGESSDTEAFEKFAKDFFIRLRGAKVTKTVGKGADGGADIVVEVGREKWLVSCKHYRSGSYIPPDVEEDPSGRLAQWGCDKFVAFYNPGPTSGLELKLRQTAVNKPSFTFELMDSGDIEREMVATASAEGWLLAMRWFPKSFSQIATALVLPLTAYSLDDVISDSGRSWLTGIGMSVSFNSDDSTSERDAAETIVEFANELATNKAFAGIFLARVREFTFLVPGAFRKPIYIDDTELLPSEVFPSWDLNMIRLLATKSQRRGLLSLCRIWSLWDLHSANLAYQYGLTLLLSDEKREQDAVSRLSSITEIGNYFRDNEDTLSFAVKNSRDRLSYSDLGHTGNAMERGYFSALLCFCPLALSPDIDKTRGVARLASRLGEEEVLTRAAYKLVDTFSASDRKYVYHKSPSFVELLISVRYIYPAAFEELARMNPSLRCLSLPLLELWQPQGIPDETLGKALGFA